MDPRVRIVSHAFSFVVVAALVATWGEPPYDDAYFFVRFAHNAIAHGTFAWNVADGPVYGLTSQLFGWLVVPVVWAFPVHAVLAIKIALAVTLAVSGAFLVRRASTLTREPLDGAALALLGVSSPVVLATVHSGMETAAALLCVTLATATGDRRPVTSAGMAALVYACRPDAALIPIVVFTAEHRKNPRAIAAYAGGLAIAIAAELALFRYFYGTSLPLPFYAKTAGFGYDDPSFQGLTLESKVRHAATFAMLLLPLLFLAFHPANRRGRPYALGAGVFALYHLAITRDVMGYHARFFVPAVPALIMAAASGWDSVAASMRRAQWTLGGAAWILSGVLLYAGGYVEHAGPASPERLLLVAYVAPLAITAWLARRSAFPMGAPRLPALPVAAGGICALASLPLGGGWPRTDAEYVARSRDAVTTFRGLRDVARCLPEVSTLYHSEVGVPGMLLPEAKVVDLAGLMSPDLALAATPFDAYCQRDRPEVIFLPHKNYAAKNREILSSECLRFYTRVVRDSSSPLYVRDDLSPRFIGCAKEIAAYQ